MVVAMREMLDNPDWCPEWVERHIRENGGFCLSKVRWLERVAPVRVFPFELPSYEELPPADSKVIALTSLSESSEHVEGHAECVTLAQALSLPNLFGLVLPT
jgi:hypothetical protein